MALDAAASGAPVKEEAKPAVAGELLDICTNGHGLLKASTSAVLNSSRLFCLSEPLQLTRMRLVLFKSLRSKSGWNARRAVFMQPLWCMGDSKLEIVLVQLQVTLHSHCCRLDGPPQRTRKAGLTTGTRRRRRSPGRSLQLKHQLSDSLERHVLRHCWSAICAFMDLCEMYWTLRVPVERHVLSHPDGTAHSRRSSAPWQLVNASYALKDCKHASEKAFD